VTRGSAVRPTSHIPIRSCRAGANRPVDRIPVATSVADKRGTRPESPERFSARPRCVAGVSNPPTRAGSSCLPFPVRPIGIFQPYSAPRGLWTVPTVPAPCFSQRCQSLILVRSRWVRVPAPYQWTRLTVPVPQDTAGNPFRYLVFLHPHPQPTGYGRGHPLVRARYGMLGRPYHANPMTGLIKIPSWYGWYGGIPRERPLGAQR